MPRHKTPRLDVRVDVASHSSLPAGSSQTFVIRDNARARNTKSRSDQPYDIFLVSDDTRAPVRALYLVSTQTYQTALAFIEHNIKAGGFAVAQSVSNTGQRCRQDVSGADAHGREQDPDCTGHRLGTDRRQEDEIRQEASK
jgi:hypothetical protein